jgi:hypothetical protein
MSIQLLIHREVDSAQVAVLKPHPPMQSGDNRVTPEQRAAAKAKEDAASFAAGSAGALPIKSLLVSQLPGLVIGIIVGFLLAKLA